VEDIVPPRVSSRGLARKPGKLKAAVGRGSRVAKAMRAVRTKLIAFTPVRRGRRGIFLLFFLFFRFFFFSSFPLVLPPSELLPLEVAGTAIGPGSPSCLKGQLDPSLHEPVEWNQHGFWLFPFPLDFPAGREEEREEREDEEPFLEEPLLEDVCLCPPPGLFSLLWENLQSSP
jgi:hypothetical protein